MLLIFFNYYLITLIILGEKLIKLKFHYIIKIYIVLITHCYQLLVIEELLSIKENRSLENYH